jgi:hypothetical protein
MMMITTPPVAAIINRVLVSNGGVPGVDVVVVVGVGVITTVRLWNGA